MRVRWSPFRGHSSPEGLATPTAKLLAKGWQMTSAEKAWPPASRAQLSRGSWKMLTADRLRLRLQTGPCLSRVIAGALREPPGVRSRQWLCQEWWAWESWVRPLPGLPPRGEAYRRPPRPMSDQAPRVCSSQFRVLANEGSSLRAQHRRQYPAPLHQRTCPRQPPLWGLPYRPRGPHRLGVRQATVRARPRRETSRQRVQAPARALPRAASPSGGGARVRVLTRHCPSTGQRSGARVSIETLHGGLHALCPARLQAWEWLSWGLDPGEGKL